MSQRKDILLRNLILNIKNPRIDECSTQADCVVAIYEDSPTSFEKLRASITTKGFLLGENILVSPDPNHKGKYIIEEGNSRVSMLKLLHGHKDVLDNRLPERLLRAHKRFPARFKAASKTVPCLIFRENEGEELINEMAIRHMSNEAKRNEWSPVRKARFARDHRGEEDPALELLERYFYSHPEKNRNWSRLYPLTYLQDFMSPMATNFGYDSPKQLADAYPDPASVDIINRLIEDIMRRKEVPGLDELQNRRKKAKEFLQENYPPSGQPIDTTPKASPRIAAGESKTAEKAGHEKDTQIPTDAHPQKRDPKSKDPIIVQIKNLRILSSNLPTDGIKICQAFREFELLMGSKEFTVTSGILLRFLLDAALRIYSHAYGIAVKHKGTLGSLLENVKKSIPNDEIKDVINKIENSEYQALHSYVHSPWIMPASEDMTSLCSTLLPMISRLLQAVIDKASKPKAPALATQAQAPQG